MSLLQRITFTWSLRRFTLGVEKCTYLPAVDLSRVFYRLALSVTFCSSTLLLATPYSAVGVTFSQEE